MSVAIQFSLPAALQLIKQEVNDLQLGQQPASLYDPLYYMMQLGGKRMRPLLTLFGCALYTPQWAKSIMPALGAEVFHNFTLIHDDLMDNADVRRGKPTVHVKWNMPTAVLSGDVMLVKAYQLMMQSPEHSLRIVLDKFNRMAAGVCEGQQYDMQYAQAYEVSLMQYLEMIKLKTAILPAFCLEIGAIIGGAPEPEAQKLYELGILLGIGFQLMDDLLDVYGNPDAFGKQMGGDIIENKNTFLLIKAKQIAQSYMAEELRYWLEAKEFKPDEKIVAVRGIYDFLNIKELTTKEIESYFSRAVLVLNSLEFADQGVKTTFKDYISDIAHRSF